MSPATARDRRPLALGAASRLLGVDPDTLRRWADDGRIDVFTTPGGHRRFERATIERVLVARRHDVQRRLAGLGATPDRISRAYRRGYANEPEGREVRDAVPLPDREAFREGGRTMIAALLAHLDAPDDAARAAAELEAERATDELAHRMAGAGIGLVDAVSLFVAARRPFLTELGVMGRRRSIDPDRLSELYDRSTALLDRLLLRLIATHEEVG